MAKSKRVQKRCDKCGRASMARPRERRCKRMESNAMGKSGFWCYGNLTRVKRTRKSVDESVKRSNRLERQRKAAKRDMWIDASRLERLVKELNIVKHDDDAGDRLAQLAKLVKRIGANIDRQHTRMKTAARKLAETQTSSAPIQGTRFVEVPQGDDDEA